MSLTDQASSSHSTKNERRGPLVRTPDPARQDDNSLERSGSQSVSP